jgi:hypothetical protein
MGALLDMADGSNDGMAFVSNQFEDVHSNLIGVAAEAAESANSNQFANSSRN